MSTSDKGFKCPYCHKSFASRQGHKRCKKRDEAEMASHGNKEDDEQANSESGFQCPYCGKSFASRQGHKRCKKRDEAEMASHGNKEDDEQANSESGFQCPYCGKSFASRQGHRRCKKRDEAEMASHGNKEDDGQANSESGFQCPYCGKSFASRQGHKRCKKRDEAEMASNGNKEDDEQANSGSGFQCPYCGKSFASRQGHKRCKKRDEAEMASSCGDSSLASGDSCERSRRDEANQVSAGTKGGDDQTTAFNDSSSLEDTEVPKESVTIPFEEDKTQKTLTKRNENFLDEGDEQKLKKICERMFEDKIIEKCRNTKSEVINFFSEEVKLRKQEMNRASGFFNPVVRKVQGELQKGTTWTWQCLKSGSFYDGTKVSRPDEMDCMFVPKRGLKNVLEASMSKDSKPAPPGFCYVKLTRQHPGLQPFCDGDYLSSTQFRQYVFRCLESLTESSRTISRDTTLSEGSPSFGVNYNTGLTNGDGSKFIISMDLVPALHFNGWPDTARDFSRGKMERLRTISKHGFHVVAKEYDGDDRHLLWRLSFSKAEKILTKFADSTNIEPESDDEEADDGTESGLSLEDEKESAAEGDHARTRKGNGCRRKSKATTDQDVEEDRGEEGAGVDTEKLMSLPASGKAKGFPRKVERGHGKGRGGAGEGPKTCRKKVLRIVKRMLEIVKDRENDMSLIAGLSPKSREVSAELRRAAEYVRSQGFTVDKHKFTTFQLRTLMWNVFYLTTTGDHVWAPGNIICRVDDVLMKLKKMLTGEMHIEHFFIKGLDIMSEVPVDERKYLYIMVCVIEKYL